MSDKNPKTEIGLVCGTKHVVRQRIQAVHDIFKENANAATTDWRTASFQLDAEPPQRIEIPVAAVSYFRIVGDTSDHGY